MSRSLHRCARCNRRLSDGRWIFSRWTTSRYCFVGDGCQKKTSQRKVRT